MPDPITLNGRLSNITIGAEGGAVIPVEVNAEEIIRALAYLDKPLQGLRVRLTVYNPQLAIDDPTFSQHDIQEIQKETQ